MADLTRVVRASDGETLIVDIDTAQTMLDAGELTVQAVQGDQLTQQDVFGEDYVAAETFTGI